MGIFNLITLLLGPVRLYIHGPKTPSVQPLPASPLNDGAAEAARLKAERTAIAESKASGRASTVVGGSVIAAEAQYARGQASQKKRMAAEQLMGGSGA